MPALQVRVFGKLRLQYGQAAINGFPTRRAEELLGYLILNPNVQHSRELLVETLWPDVALSNGRASLSTALWRLRSVFDQLGVPAQNYVQTGRDWVAFEPQPDLELDLREFEEHLAKAHRAADPAERDRALRAAADLYAGIFCEGIYAEWCLIARERLERHYLQTLGQLMAGCMERCNFEEAVTLGQDILRRDPLREEVHRAVMVCFWKLGLRARAVRQFQRCARLLQTELQILPMPETIDLYRQIVAERMQELFADGRHPPDRSRDLDAAFAAFLAAAQDLDMLLEQIEQSWEPAVIA